jgi:hypothetical protein
LKSLLAQDAVLDCLFLMLRIGRLFSKSQYIATLLSGQKVVTVMLILLIWHDLIAGHVPGLGG